MILIIIITITFKDALCEDFFGIVGFSVGRSDVQRADGQTDTTTPPPRLKSHRPEKRT